MKYNLVFLIIISFNLTQNYSQLKDSNNLETSKYKNENLYINSCNHILGPVVGYSLKSKVPVYVLNYEYAFSQNDKGIFTGGIIGKYSTNKEEGMNNSAELKTQIFSFGLQANFNLNRLDAKRIIPFAGIIIGYSYSKTQYSFDSDIENPLFPDTKKNSLYIHGQTGIRIFFSRNAALNIRIGTGSIDKSLIEAGFDINLK